MSDLISRQAAIDAMAELQGSTSSKGVLKGISKAWKRIKQLPPIQPEIIRCKDCKHYRHGLCMKASMCVNKSENGFCDWAERREVNNESN